MELKAKVYKAFISFVSCAAVGMFIFLYFKQTTLEQRLFDSVAMARHDLTNQPVLPIVEKVVSSFELWRPIQNQLKDTVVQVVSNVAQFDLLEPYKSPAVGQGTGTGFFIDAQGEIVTNAHVVDGAKSIWIQVPSLGKTILDADLISINHDSDIALLRLKPESLEIVSKELGAIPYITLGDSDLVRRSDDVLALGYPLGQATLKSTSGVVSGREGHFIQMSAALNPGNSGGPLLNTRGEVIGINSAHIRTAQNIGYAIPINDFKNIMNDMHTEFLIRKPFLGIIFTQATSTLVEYLGNPLPGGCYIIEVMKNTTLDKAGVKPGDMIYEINGHKIDIFGDMVVPWGEDKMTLSDYVGRLSIGNNIDLVVYRNGVKKNIRIAFNHAQLPAIHKIFPAYESLDYEAFGGMVVVPLTINHVYLMGKVAPGLGRFLEAKNQIEPVLLVSHIFPNSQLYRTRSLVAGCILKEVNGIKVSTLADFRAAISKPKNNEYFTIAFSDMVANTSDSILIVVPWKKIIEEEPQLARDFRYPLSTVGQEVLKFAHVGNSLNQALTS